MTWFHHTHWDLQPSSQDAALTENLGEDVTEIETGSLSAEELEARYEEERIKRMTEGVRTYRSLRDLDVDFDADPYTPGSSVT